MFTGIVEATGTVTEMAGTETGRRMTISSPEIARGLEVGDSVAVQGACLTAVEITPAGFSVEMVAETLQRTAFADVAVGTVVNLERAMPASGRFDGHIVQGHVDGVGSVEAVEIEGEGRRLTIRLPEGLDRYVVEKGSITIDGVSLTVASVGDRTFGVALIPHTLAVTTLGLLQAGARVNLEVDILAKYVDRLLEARS
ncbi:MAG: riboflavin synthase [Acidimicrobiia bacterium]|nr:riboflavin synthase [Acidimicrobiia bacterium]